MALLMMQAAASPAPAGAGAGAVAVEIVASGHVDAPAQRFRFTAKIAAEGADEEAAKAALDAKRQALTARMAALRVTPAAATTEKSPSFLSLISGMAGGMPSVSAATAGEDGAEGQPARASIAVSFDAPDQATAARAVALAKAEGGEVTDPVIPLLIDPVPATRQAKAAVLAKARDEAGAYAAALGLSRPTLIRVSEKQDLSASLDLVKQVVTLFSKPPGGSATVPVDVTLTVEFRLDR